MTPDAEVKCPYTDAHRAIVRAYDEHARRKWKRGSRKHAAKAIGCSESALSQLISGTYPADTWRDFLDAMRRIIERDGEAAAAIAPPPFVPTNVSDVIEGLILHCRARRCLGFVCGTPGVGKSWAIRRFAKANQDTYLVVCNQTFSAATWLRHMAAALDVQAANSRSHYFDACAEALAERGGVVIVDEIDYGQDVLDIARQLFDASGCGQVWIGTEAFLDKLRHQRRGTKGQALSRIAITRMAKTIDLESTDRILTAWDAAKFQRAHIRAAHDESRGNARRLALGMVLAVEHARADNDGKVTVEIIHDAFAELMPIEAVMA